MESFLYKSTIACLYKKKSENILLNFAVKEFRSKYDLHVFLLEVMYYINVNATNPPLYDIILYIRNSPIHIQGLYEMVNVLGRKR